MQCRAVPCMRLRLRLCACPCIQAALELARVPYWQLPPAFHLRLLHTLCNDIVSPPFSHTHARTGPHPCFGVICSSLSSSGFTLMHASVCSARAQTLWQECPPPYPPPPAHAHGMRRRCRAPT